MSRDRHKSDPKAAVAPPRKASGAPRASRQSDKGLVALLASAPGTSVKALQGQFLLCTVLGVLLLAVLLSLATDAHTRARLYSPSVPLQLSLVQGRMGASGAEGRAESDADAPASASDSDSEEAGDSETGAASQTGEETGEGTEAGTEAEAGAGPGQGRKSQRLGMKGARGRARKGRRWPRIFAKGHGAMSFLFGRHQRQGRKARRHTRSTTGAHPWYTRKPRGRALSRHSAGDRAAGAARVQLGTGNMPQTTAGPQRSLPRWVPQPGRYFLAFCQLYQWTNKLICMEKALMLAVMLNRTLILPQRNVCASPRRSRSTDHMLVDVQHLRECLAQGILTNEVTNASSATSADAGSSPQQGGLAGGAGGGAGRGQGKLERRARRLRAVHERLASYGVVTLHEYQKALGVRAVTADVVLCDTRKCPFKHCNSLGRLQFANFTRPPLQLYRHHLTVEDLEVLHNVTAHAHVLSFGDLFYTSVRDYPLPIRTSLGPLLGTSCPLPVRPHQGIFELAEGLAQNLFKGVPYAALHLRRGDFEKYLVERRIPYWSIPQVADCLAWEMNKLGLSMLFLATDALYPERRQLQALLGARNITFRLYRPGWRQTTMNQALVDKVMCAHAEVFLYERLSTFSGHILQLREGLGRSSSHDKPLCAGRHARFVPQAV